MSKVIEAILRLSFDKQAVADGRGKLAEVKKELTRLEGEATALRAALTAALAQGKPADKLRSDLAQVEQAITDVQQAAKKGLANQLFEQTKQQVDQIKEHADRLEAVSVQVGAVGAGIGAGFFAAASNYASTVGEATATGRQWAAVNKELEQSYLSLGQTAAQSLLPFMQTAAGLMEKAADFARQNPGAARAVLGLAGGAALLGGLGTLVSQGVKLVMDAKYLAAAALQNKAAQTMLTAAGIQAKAAGGMGGGLLGKVAGGAALAAAGTGGALLAGGTALGAGGYEAARALVPGGENWGSLGQIASVMGGGVGLAAGTVMGDDNPMERANKWFADVAYALGEIDEKAWNAAHGLDAAGEALDNVGDSDPIITQEAVDAYIQYQAEIAAAEEQYGEQRRQIVEQYGEQRAAAEERYEARRAEVVETYEARKAQEEEDFQRRRSRQLRDFMDDTLSAWQDHQERLATAAETSAAAQAQANKRYNSQTQKLLADAARASNQAEAQYYRQRQQAVQGYSVEVQRAEEDHLREMRRLQQDHQMNLEDAVRGNDAIGFLREQRGYNVTRQRAEEDHQVEMARRSEDFAAQLRQMEESFAEQQAAREGDRQRRLEEMKTQFEEDRAQRQADQQLRLEEMKSQFSEMQAERQKDFQQRLTDEGEDRAVINERAEQQFQDQLGKMDEQYAAEQEKLTTAKDEQLSTLDQQYQDENQKRETAFADQIRQLDAHLLGEYNTRQQYYNQMTTQFKTWLSTMQASMPGSNLPNYPSRRFGGYVSGGLYNLHDNEFVMSPTSTAAAERALGGSLSQDRILAGLAGARAGGGNRSLNYAPQYNFAERDDARLIVNQIMQQVDNKLLKLERGY